MSNIYDAIDFKFSWRGDFLSSIDGDFSDTSDDQIQSLIQEIQTIANSSLGDWEENSQYASSLDDFIGEPNNRDTASDIIDRLTTALISNNVVRSEDLSIRAVPINKNQLLLIVSVQAVATTNNSIVKGSNPVVSIVYDWSERGVFFI